ncbi:hypothetical protein H0H92_000480 [Tricholoma furcatifolium]|nr:hypothetical protein H0H92_000480 [Tricholoma furcatifolium]
MLRSLWCGSGLELVRSKAIIQTGVRHQRPISIYSSLAHSQRLVKNSSYSYLRTRTMSTYKKLDSPKGLIFVVSEPGPVPEEEYNGIYFINFPKSQKSQRVTQTDWYDNEHIALRLSVPGILSTARFKAVDSQKPSWLALYDITSPEVSHTPEYKSLASKGSPREKQIMANLATVNRRVYEHLVSYIRPDTDLTTLPAQYVFVVHMRVVSGDAEEEFNRWYNEEHMVLLSKVPGWVCGKRYKLLESVSRGVKLEPEEGERPYTDYLAIHELESQGFMGLPEFNDAIKTPWRERVMKSVISSELRLFERYKVFRPLYPSQGE